MKGYLSIRETSYKCSISEHRVNQYVAQGRIPVSERLDVHEQSLILQKSPQFLVKKNRQYLIQTLKQNDTFLKGVPA